MIYLYSRFGEVDRLQDCKAFVFGFLTHIKVASIEGSLITIAACFLLFLSELDMLKSFIGRKTLPPARSYQPYRHITKRWTTSGKIEGMASIPAQNCVIFSCYASRTGPRDPFATAGAHTNATQEDGPDFDWQWLDDVDVGSGAGTGSTGCFGLTDTEEEDLMVWHFGWVNGIVRYDEVIITYEDTPSNLLKIPIQAYSPRTFRTRYP